MFVSRTDASMVTLHAVPVLQAVRSWHPTKRVNDIMLQCGCVVAERSQPSANILDKCNPRCKERFRYGDLYIADKDSEEPGYRE